MKCPCQITIKEIEDKLDVTILGYSAVIIKELIKRLDNLVDINDNLMKEMEKKK